MSKAEKVQLDFAKMRTEILAEVATHFDLTLGERIVQKILERGYERTANLQKASTAAVAEAEDARRQKSAFEERLVLVQSQIKDLAKERNDLQNEVAKLRADYDALLPKVQELRAEHQSYVARVQKIAG